MEVAAPESLPVLARAHADARKNWEAACAYAEEVQVTAGQLIPLDRLRDVQRTAVSRLGQIVRAWPNNIALRLPPELHAHYYAAERAERPALRRAILDLDAALEGLVASC